MWMGETVEGAKSYEPRFTPIVLLISLVVLAGMSPLFVTGWRLDVFQVRPGDLLQPKIQLWLMCVIAQSALWVLCIFYLAWDLARVKAGMTVPLRSMKAASTMLLPPGLLLIAVVGQQFLRPPALPPRILGGYDISRLHWFGAIGMLVAGWAVWQMYWTSVVWEAEFASTEPQSEKIAKYLERREDVLRLLLLAALVLTLGTIAGAALRSAVNTDRHSDYFAEEYVVIYGAVYSLLLMVAYVPVYTKFFTTGLELRKQLCGEPPESAADFKPWKETRDAIDDSMGLKLSSAAALGPALSALLPVLAAWAASLLGAKK
jgi:hypothetical protein